jgi:hypothetical protein
MAGGSPTLPLTPSGPLFDYSLKWMSGLDILVRDRGGLLRSRAQKQSHILPCTDCATSSAITNRKTWGQTNQEILGQTCGRAWGRGRPRCLHSERRVGSNETDSRSWEYRSVSSCHAREGGPKGPHFVPLSSACTRPIGGAGKKVESCLLCCSRLAGRWFTTSRNRSRVQGVSARYVIRKGKVQHEANP